jgi:DNA polymerase
MAKRRRPSQEELERMERQRLESLRAAGVEYLPRPEPGPPPIDEEEPTAESASPGPVPANPAVPASLFDEPAPAPTAAAPAAQEALSPDERRRELTVLAERVSQCTRCPLLASKRTQTVFGVGPIDAELCFVGEAPGADEDRQGEPFVGAAGQLLNRIIAACGMKREDVYICNIIRCRPPGNRPPLADEAANCREYLERTLDLVRPRFLCALGGTAAQHLLGTTQGVGKLRGRFHDHRGIPVLVTYHPAALLPSRSPEKKKDVWDDMKMLLARMGRPIPGK